MSQENEVNWQKTPGSSWQGLEGYPGLFQSLPGIEVGGRSGGSGQEPGAGPIGQSGQEPTGSREIGEAEGGGGGGREGGRDCSPGDAL